MTTLEVISVNTSEKKGTVKIPCESIELTYRGVLGDAHMEQGNRMVSLLAEESIQSFAAEAKREFGFGMFAENITTRGMVLNKMSPLDKLYNDKIILEVTQIGKKCHSTGCSIFRETGNCVMPKEGIFCRVIKTGTMKPGDKLSYEPKSFKIYCLTVSDRASMGIYEDKSGPALKKSIEDYFKPVGRNLDITLEIVGDEISLIRERVKLAADNNFDFVFTTGGTGMSSRDTTPEAIQPLLEKEVPGIMELIRVKYGMNNHKALMSRSIAGLRKQTYIYTLPGSVDGVKEYMEVILPTLQHSLYMAHNLDVH